MSDGSDFQVCGVSSVCRAYKHCYTLLWSELCCVRTVTVIPCCDLSSAVYALSYRAVIWALLCTHCHTVLWSELCCVRTVIPRCDLSSAVYALSYRAVIWALLCTHCHTALWSELCCIRTVIPRCELSSAVYALSYRAVIWALLCTHCHTVLWPVCACTLSVVEKAESREHCEAERSRSREQQALLCVRIHERKSVSDDKGQVGFILLIHSCFCVPCWEPCQPQPLWGLLKPQPTRTHSAYHRIQNMVQSSGRRPLAVFWS